MKPAILLLGLCHASPVFAAKTPAARVAAPAAPAQADALSAELERLLQESRKARERKLGQPDEFNEDLSMNAPGSDLPLPAPDEEEGP